MNILIGEENPTSGKVSRHLGARITMLQQHHYKGEQLDPNLTPLVIFLRIPLSFPLKYKTDNNSNIKFIIIIVLVIIVF